MCESMSRAEASILMEFANTIEDPAIEYFAPQLFGGRLLDSLRFSIKHIYKLSPGIEKSKTPFSQLINALINFGDMGIVKGEWTFPEAKEMFRKVAPVYNRAITCPDSKKRIDYAKECMKITKPLWEKDVQDAEIFEKLLKELSEFLQRAGLKLFDDSQLETGNSEISEKRDSLISALGGSSDKNEEKENGKSSGESSDSNKSENKADKDDEKASSQKGSSSDCNDSKEKASSDGGDVDPIDNATMNENEANSIAEEQYEITEDLLKSIEEGIKSEADAINKSKAKGENDFDKGKLPNFDITSENFIGKRASCINRRMSNSAGPVVSEMYANALSAYSYEIKNLTKTLDRLFKADREQVYAATSGDYNIIRGSLGTTARIFDKRRDPDKLKDAAVVLLVDLSGSMGGSKVNQARKTAITMAEALSACRIPYYVMGFHADKGADAVHDHFVTWSNKKSDRETLVAMNASGNNFDGYSIRYAGELLKRRSENNKILFVISDGQPSCRKYRGSNGIADTIDAIKQVRKFSTVFGIAVGYSCGPVMLQKMYGRDFIFVENEALLTNMLCKKLTKVLAKK